MLIGELKTTLNDTIGTKWKSVKTITTLTWIASVIIFILASKDVGFIGVVGSSLILTYLTGREYVIASLHRIRTITTLRERLLVYGDGEFVLRDIANDQIWRGETVDPEITKRLEDLARAKNDMADQIMKLATELFNPDKVEDKTPN